LQHDLEEKVLHIACSAIDGNLGLLEAVNRLFPILVTRPDLVSLEDFNFVCAVESQTDDLPTGRLRNEWHPDFLPEKDREIARCEEIWGSQILKVCERVRRALLLRKLVT